MNGKNKTFWALRDINVVKWNKHLFLDLFETGREVAYRTRELVIGWFFAHIDPIR